MPARYIHLSDIHFGQEKGGHVIIHNDAKDRLIEDVTSALSKLPGGGAQGILVTGDIAYSGKAPDYVAAGDWLERLATAARCKSTDIQLVPGNHDIDLGRISSASKLMLDTIAAKGEGELDKFLSSEQDRELLYSRFAAYRPFAEGHDCSLDCAGGLASDRFIDLTPNRRLRFIGFNSALACRGKRDEEEKGFLLLGAKQRVLPIESGQELVVLCHHPLGWLQDSDDARKFIRSRARVFISGHEHQPDVDVVEIEPGQDLMMLAAGATVPPFANDKYNYTYNIIEFDWDAEKDALKVSIFPRAWDDDKKQFREDQTPLKGKPPHFVLGSPNFRRAVSADLGATTETCESEEQEVKPEEAAVSPSHGLESPPDDLQQYRLALLRFFRDLSSAERLAILIELKGLPSNWAEPLTQSIERRAFDQLRRLGKLQAIENSINATLEKRS